MSASSQPIVLNFKATSSIPAYEFTLSAGQIIFVDTPTGTTDGRILYNNYGADYEQVIVTETAAAIASASLTLIAVTESTSGSVQYINPDYIVNMTDNATAGTDIKYFMLGAVPKIITVDDTRAALLVLIDAVIPDASGTYVTLSGNNAFTGTETFSNPNAYANATTITAFATGGQASATALTKEQNNVTVCATAGDSVKLPTAVAGLRITVKNSGATALDIFPAASDSIDALAVNLAVRIQPGSVATFYCISGVVWESSVDETITIVAPTTNTGALVLKAAASAGNFTTTVVNASQAAARVYTIPDAGASASFVQTEGAQTINGIKTFGSGIVTPAGAVGTPSVQVGSVDTGLYQVSGSQTGFSQDGALVGGYNTSGLFTGAIAEQVAAAGVAVDSTLLKDGLVITKATPVAINSTAAATAAEIVSGYITSTSAAAVAITTPTATAIAALIGAVQGTSFDLVIDNSAGANTVTLTLDGSIAVVTPALTGGDTLTVTTGNAIGVFRLVFNSGTTAKIFRIA